MENKTKTKTCLVVEDKFLFFYLQMNKNRTSIDVRLPINII